MADAFTPELAQTVLNIEPPQDVVQRVEQLGDKANEGTITDEERAEYLHYIDIGNVIGLWKAKARKLIR